MSGIDLFPPLVRLEMEWASQTDFADPLAGCFEQEAALVAAAVPKRRAEFGAGRRCAHAALASLGVPPAPLLAGGRREPLWSDGVVGSITHCDGFAAAAVGFASKTLRSVGLDAEPNQPLPVDVLPDVSLPRERAMLAALFAVQPTVCWDRLLFSAKEALYKAWFPLTGEWLGFEQADLKLTVDGEFRAQLSAVHPAVPPMLAGRWRSVDGVLLTSVSIADPAAPATGAADTDSAAGADGVDRGAVAVFG